MKIKRRERRLTLSRNEELVLKFILEFMKTSKTPPILGEVLVGTGLTMQELAMARSRLLDKEIVDFGFVKKYHFKPKKKYQEALNFLGNN